MEKIEISKVKPNERNPRQITEENYERLKRSLQEFPEMLHTRPLIVDENNVLIGGNQRLKVLKELGWNGVPVERVTGWSEEKKKQFIAKDNLVDGDWDYEILSGSEWKEMPLEEWGIHLPDWEIFDEEDEDLEEPKIEEEINESAGEIRTVMFLFKAEEYTEIQEKLRSARDYHEVTNNTDLLKIFLEPYESNS